MVGCPYVLKYICNLIADNFGERYCLGSLLFQRCDIYHWEKASVERETSITGTVREVDCHVTKYQTRFQNGCATHINVGIVATTTKIVLRFETDFEVVIIQIKLRSLAILIKSTEAF